MKTKRKVCSQRVHEAMKRFPMIWLSLEYKGKMESGLPGTYLELRNCRCGSTLAIELEAKKQEE